MRLVLIIAVVLLLGGGGFAAWYFLMRDGEMPEIIASPYPKESVHLGQDVAIHNPDNGITVISAASRADLYYTQGLVHGRLGGRKLETLRNMFRGQPGAGPDPEAARLAELFYFLDLSHTAEQSLERYTPQLKEILNGFAKGIEDAKQTKEPWTAVDVLLMQRGYAFLQSRALVKEWTANQLLPMFPIQALGPVLGYAPTELGGLEPTSALAATLKPLFAPMLQTVRMTDADGTSALQTRARPSLTFVFQPMVLELRGGFSVEGISMLGVPFLIAGRNAAMVWHIQPILSDNEQFSQVNRDVYLGRPDMVMTRDDAPHADDYASPPMHAAQGRMVSSMISGRDNMDTWYYWDGFRPSADLTAAYKLMEADSIDAARTAFQYHQTPAVELYLEKPDGRKAAVTLRSANPTLTAQERAGQPFASSHTRVTRAFPQRGDSFHRTASLVVEKAVTLGVSGVDKDLLELLQFHARENAPVPAPHTPEQAARIREILAARGGANARDYFLQQVWAGLHQYATEQEKVGLLRLDLPFKRAIPRLLGRAMAADEVTMPQSRRRVIIWAALGEALSAMDQPTGFSGIDAKGGETTLPHDQVVQSADGLGGAVFVDYTGQVVMQAVQMVQWQPTTLILQYEAQKTQVRKPKKLNSMARDQSPKTVRSSL